MKNAFIIGFVNFWILSSTFSFGQSQFKNVQIPPVKSSYAFNECEPSIAINPRNTNEIAAGSVLKGYHYSIDGGLTWTSKKMSSPYRMERKFRINIGWLLIRKRMYCT
jgi:hypothetical protein